jgi:hypothetical protein
MRPLHETNLQWGMSCPSVRPSTPFITKIAEEDLMTSGTGRGGIWTDSSHTKLWLIRVLPMSLLRYLIFRLNLSSSRVTKHHTMKDVQLHAFSNPGTRCMWVVRFTPQPLYPRSNSPPCSNWIGGCVGPRAGLDSMWIEISQKSHMKIRVIQCSCVLVIVTMTPQQFLHKIFWFNPIPQFLAMSTVKFFCNASLNRYIIHPIPSHLCLPLLTPPLPNDSCHYSNQFPMRGFAEWNFSAF